jgi:hypothetical protein
MKHNNHHENTYMLVALSYDKQNAVSWKLWGHKGGNGSVTLAPSYDQLPAVTGYVRACLGYVDCT